MATLTMDLQSLTAATVKWLQDSLIDFNAVGTPFLDNDEKFWGKSGDGTDGGPLIQITYENTEHSSTTVWGNGYESLNLVVQTIGNFGTQDWAHWARPAVYSDHEMEPLSGQSKKIDMIKARVNNARLYTRRELHQRLWGKTPGTSVLTAVDTLNGFDDASGWLTRAASGAQTQTIQGISQTSNQNTKGWQYVYYDLAGSAGSNLLDRLDQAEAELQIRSGLNTDTSKQVYYASQAMAAHFTKLVRPFEQFAGKAGERADVGGLVGMFNRRPIVVNPDAPTAGSTTTTYPWSLVMVDHAHVRLYALNKIRNRAAPWKEYPATLVKYMYFENYLNLITDWLGTNAVFANGETF